MEQEKLNKEIAIPNFYGEGEHVYKSDLGWGQTQKEEARSLVSKEIFDFEVVKVGLNLAFYYIDNDTFYGIHTESLPIEVKILPRDKNEPYIGWQCEGDTHADGDVLFSFDDASKIWDNVIINGKKIDEVLERSFIVALN